MIGLRQAKVIDGIHGNRCIHGVVVGFFLEQRAADEQRVRKQRAERREQREGIIASST